MNKKNKKIFTFIVIFLFFIWITSSLYLYFSWFNFETYFWKLELNIYYKILIILFIYIFRNYLFIPSTVIILFAWFFLQNFLLTCIISIIWVSIGVLQAYFVGYIFWEDLKEKKSFQLITQYNQKIQNDGFKVIFLWAFFPIIPVDILYYSAWLVKYSLIKSYLAGILWEMPLIILYSYLWKEALKYSDYFLYIWGALWIWYIIYLLIKKLFYKK